MRAIMALLAVAKALVWDGVAWTWRVARAVLGAPSPDVGEALAEANEVEAPAPEMTSDEIMGHAALSVLAPFAGEEVSKTLPHRVEVYLRELSMMQRAKLASLQPARIGEFLNGGPPVKDLPPVPSEAIFSARLLDLALDARDAEEAEDAKAANDKFALDVIQDLLDDLDRKLAA
jgi:hypothetical protein